MSSSDNVMGDMMGDGDSAGSGAGSQAGGSSGRSGMRGRRRPVANADTKDAGDVASQTSPSKAAFGASPATTPSFESLSSRSSAGASLAMEGRSDMPQEKLRGEASRQLLSRRPASEDRIAERSSTAQSEAMREVAKHRPSPLRDRLVAPPPTVSDQDDRSRIARMTQVSQERERRTRETGEHAHLLAFMHMHSDSDRRRIDVRRVDAQREMQHQQEMESRAYERRELDRRDANRDVHGATPTAAQQARAAEQYAHHDAYDRGPIPVAQEREPQGEAAMMMREIMLREQMEERLFYEDRYFQDLELARQMQEEERRRQEDMLREEMNRGMNGPQG